MTRPISRRAFIDRIALLSLSVSPANRLFSGRSATTLHLGIVGGADDGRQDGALLGVEEARHAAAMFGGSVTLTTIDNPSRAPRDVAAVLGPPDAGGCATLVRSVAGRATLVMNVACSADALRGSGCSPSLFHVAPSDAMLRDAVAQSDTGGDARAWDPSLDRFGADTLNQRFRARFHRDMTSNAWSAWLAVKILWESSLRAKSADSSKLAEFMRRDGTQFDGHKGRPLSFRRWDQQLRQPLYVIRGAAVAEVPVAKNPDESSRDLLDRLGSSESSSPCRLAP